MRAHVEQITWLTYIEAGDSYTFYFYILEGKVSFIAYDLAPDPIEIILHFQN